MRSFLIMAWLFIWWFSLSLFSGCATQTITVDKSAWSGDEVIAFIRADLFDQAEDYQQQAFKTPQGTAQYYLYLAMGDDCHALANGKWSAEYLSHGKWRVDCYMGGKHHTYEFYEKLRQYVPAS